MIHFLGRKRYTRHESECLRKVFKLKTFDQTLFGFFPHKIKVIRWQVTGVRKAPGLKDQILLIAKTFVRHFRDKLHAGNHF